MIKVINSLIPFKGYVAMSVFPFIFIRREFQYVFRTIDERHEKIHGAQQLEMLFVGALIAAVMAVIGCGWWSLLGIPVFLWWYLTEYLVRCIDCPDTSTAYRNISFEQEAYNNESDPEYLASRKLFAWTKYIFRKTYRRQSPGGSVFEGDDF